MPCRGKCGGNRRHAPRTFGNGVTVDTATSNVRRLIIEVDIHGDGYGVDRMYDEGAAGEFAAAAIREKLVLPPGGGQLRAYVHSAYWHNVTDAPTTQSKAPVRGDRADTYLRPPDATLPR